MNYRGLVNIADEYEKQICVCKTCTHVFEANPIEESVLADYYKNLSKYENISELTSLPEENVKMAKRQVDFIEGTGIKVESVLDIGASMGALLSEFRNRGYNDLYGIEPSENNKKYVREQFDLEYFTGTLEEYVVSEIDKKYDLVTLSHVLEHTSNPVEFVNNIKKINGKYFFLEVPVMNITMCEEPYGIFFYEHLGYFSNESLSYLMKKCGYKPLRMSIEYNLDGEAPQFPTLVSLWEIGEGRVIENSMSMDVVLEEYINDSERLLEKVNNRIKEIKSDKLAVYGTGSHTSKLLGMTLLSEKNIVKFYDSDWKKDGLMIMDKVITPFDIEDIKNGIVDTILISTYASEIAIKKYILNITNDVVIITLYDDGVFRKTSLEEL